MKKGFLFTLMLCIMTIIILIQAFFIISEKQQELLGEQKGVGEAAGQMLGAQMDAYDQDLFIESLAYLSASYAMRETAKIGASACGWQEGIPIYADEKSGPATCIRRYEETGSNIMKKRMNEILLGQGYQPVQEIISFGDPLEIMGQCAAPNIVAFSLNKGRIYNRCAFHIKTQLSHEPFRKITEGLNLIRERCSISNPDECINSQIRELSRDDLVWQMRPCDGAPLTKDRYKTFCVTTNRYYPIHDVKQLVSAPIEYQFGAYIPIGTPLEIESFKANGLPTTGNPNINAVIAVSAGDDISYEAEIRGYRNDMQSSICLGDTCEKADNIIIEEGIARLYGSIKSPEAPYEIHLKINDRDSTIINNGKINAIKRS